MTFFEDSSDEEFQADPCTVEDVCGEDQSGNRPFYWRQPTCHATGRGKILVSPGKVIYEFQFIKIDSLEVIGRQRSLRPLASHEVIG